MANFAGNWNNRPFQGNLGVRIFNTSIEAVAWRTEYEIVEDGDEENRCPHEGGQRPDSVTAHALQSSTPSPRARRPPPVEVAHEPMRAALRQPTRRGRRRRR